MSDEAFEERPPHEKYARLMARAAVVKSPKTVVVYPCDESSLNAAVEAAEAELIEPLLVGPTQKIKAVAEKFSLDISRYEIVEAEHSEEAAAKGVDLIGQAKGEVLMKGSLHTDELMRAVTAKTSGLRTARRISHAFIMDVPTYKETLLITDAAINIFPDLEAKRDIVQNAIDLYTHMGQGTPRVAILSAVETVTPKIPSTIDAAALCKMAERGQITGGVLDGPLAFDNAIDPEAAAIKGIKSEVAGRAQILIVPDLEAGNMLAKNLTFLLKADFGRHRSWRTRAHHSHFSGGFAQGANGVLRGGGALRRRASARNQPAGGVSVMDEILVANAGSSSVKFELFGLNPAGALESLLEGKIEGVGTKPHLTAKSAEGKVLVERTYSTEAVPHVPAALHTAGAWLRDELQIHPIAVGHRVVHGGPDFDQPVLVTEEISAPAGAIYPARAAASAAQSGADPLHHGQPAGTAAGRLLRHRIPPQAPRRRRLFRHP